jgi:hypothetical protein
VSNHRNSGKHRVNPLLSGVLVAGGLLLAAAPIASAAPGVGGRPPSGPAPQPGVDAIQRAGDSVFDNAPQIPTLSLTGQTVPLSNTSVGRTYHALYGNSVNTQETDGNGVKVAPRQGLTIGVVNSIATGYNVQCNIVVQTRCGAP